jgi:hypothetical protein
MSIVVSDGVDIVASFITCLAQVSEQQHLPLLVGPCGDLEMNAKSCRQRILYRANGKRCGSLNKAKFVQMTDCFLPRMYKHKRQ